MGCGAGASVDSVWEQRKHEAREMLAVGAARRVPSVQCIIILVLVRDAVLGRFVSHCGVDYQPTPLVFIVAKTKLELETA
jgi:hypothetical protein